MTVTLTISPGGPTKGQIVQLAYGAMNIDDPDADEVVSALLLLDAMMAENPWNGLGYEAASYGAGLPTDGSGITADALSGVYHELALRIAPTKGKTLSAEFKAAHARSVGYVKSKVAAAQMPAMARHPASPRGSGARGQSVTQPYLVRDA